MLSMKFKDKRRQRGGKEKKKRKKALSDGGKWISKIT